MAPPRSGTPPTRPAARPRSARTAQAAAQYGRALRFAGRRAAGDRADLLERRAAALYAADDQVASIADLHAAIALHRELVTSAARREATALLVPR